MGKQYVVEFGHNDKWWLSYGSGDQPRTVVIGNALMFHIFIYADLALKDAIYRNPHRDLSSGRVVVL